MLEREQSVFCLSFELGNFYTFSEIQYPWVCSVKATERCYNYIG